MKVPVQHLQSSCRPSLKFGSSVNLCGILALFFRGQFYCQSD
jgi:hypothetical protein